MRILIVTEAWMPQVNGVVTTLSRVGRALVEDGHEVLTKSPKHLVTVRGLGYKFEA